MFLGSSLPQIEFVDAVCFIVLSGEFIFTGFFRNAWFSHTKNSALLPSLFPQMFEWDLIHKQLINWISGTHV